MEAFILITSIILICFILYIVNSRICKNNLRNTSQNFKVEIFSDNIVTDYVERMPLQYKDNERLLDGTGKMHFSKVVENGSDLVKLENISVLKSVGERFS